MLQFDLQFYEELTVAWVRTVKFISGAFFWPTGQLVCQMYRLKQDKHTDLGKSAVVSCYYDTVGIRKSITISRLSNYPV